MKEIPLTKGYVAIVDDCDFERLSKISWRANERRRRDGSVRDVYASATDAERRHLKLHRVVLGITDPKVFCDHKNHNGLDNRRENLRQCTPDENARNKRIAGNKRQGLKGVFWNKRSCRWSAAIKCHGVNHNLGSFADEAAAHSVYVEASIKMFGEFACKG